MSFSLCSWFWTLPVLLFLNEFLCCHSSDCVTTPFMEIPNNNPESVSPTWCVVVNHCRVFHIYINGLKQIVIFRWKYCLVSMAYCYFGHPNISVVLQDTISLLGNCSSWGTVFLPLFFWYLSMWISSFICCSLRYITADYCMVHFTPAFTVFDSASSLPVSLF